MKLAAFSVFSAVLPSLVHGSSYRLSEDWSGHNFLSNFHFETFDDPTHGRVQYVDRDKAFSENLVRVSRDSVILAADHKTKLSSGGPGRKSVRIRSKRQFHSGVTVFDIRHMPEGCGTWPAVWTLGDNWPTNGEIDILEGVNNQPFNEVTLHTSKGCTMPRRRRQTGEVQETNCDARANSNTGCGVKSADRSSFGPRFNDNGGGWYALEKTSDFIKIWFWSREDPSVPSDVRKGSAKISTGKWGKPTGYFPGDDCDIDKFFGPQNIVINLTFCGDWAGNTYERSKCPSNCINYVNKHPEAFKDAFFDFAGIRFYESGSGVQSGGNHDGILDGVFEKVI
ncbi:glycoside hydrolase family 16 protein [Cylindrobasidium torrendii FP15055 ss-10]|uniref:Glycoside hydrolase family 16 protein n=1 Tax=Cylindrobasidium torrendii FP15055 ss-10 TaxID=1314674 RepID=A0A0D7B822_9AGAR|nr:glycoside hydrolase family 16 protein [Cylindrobasidium torrendii FP15055 ss-10]